MLLPCGRTEIIFRAGLPENQFPLHPPQRSRTASVCPRTVSVSRCLSHPDRAPNLPPGCVRCQFSPRRRRVTWSGCVRCQFSPRWAPDLPVGCVQCRFSPHRAPNLPPGCARCQFSPRRDGCSALRKASTRFCSLAPLILRSCNGPFFATNYLTKLSKINWGQKYQVYFGIACPPVIYEKRPYGVGGYGYTAGR